MNHIPEMLNFPILSNTISAALTHLSIHSPLHEYIQLFIHSFILIQNERPRRPVTVLSCGDCDDACCKTEIATVSPARRPNTQ